MQMADGDSKPTSDRMAPFWRMVQDKQQLVLNRVVSGEAAALQHYHQMVLVPIGIAGVVIPLLNANHSFTDERFLWWATVFLCVAVTIGVALLMGVRWATAHALRLIVKHHTEQNRLLLCMDGDDVATYVSAFDKSEADFTRLDERQVPVRLGALGDVLFYGSIVGGILCISWSITGK